ncbi:hypothetical protein N9D67_06980 [Gammaproteobacteria bacterium]|nr:hypothetical protein [Gammaproteobacteria bacterium]
MKKLFLLSTLILSFGVAADDHLPSNYSMYQSNFLFNCPEPERCFAAFDKYMSSPEVAAENFEVDFFAINQNGWDDSTHGISWYFLNEDQYAKSGQIYSTSMAGKKFRKAMNNIGAEIISDTLTVHTVGVTNKGDSTSNRVTLRWSHEVTDPANFLPLWTEFTKSIEGYEWSANAYGLQSHLLGNNGNGISHEVWTSHSSPQAALKFLSGMYGSKEFAQYAPESRKYATFKRSYMEVSLKQYNPD